VARRLLVAPDGGVVDAVLEGSLEVRIALGATPEAHLLAEIVAAGTADAALRTRNADLQCHPVAHAEALDLGADGNDDARRLMAQGERLTGAEVAVGKLLEI